MTIMKLAIYRGGLYRSHALSKRHVLNPQNDIGYEPQQVTLFMIFLPLLYILLRRSLRNCLFAVTLPTVEK